MSTNSNPNPLEFWDFDGRTPKGGTPREHLPEALQPYAPELGARMQIRPHRDSKGPYVRMVGGAGWGLSAADLIQGLRFRPVPNESDRIRYSGSTEPVPDGWQIEAIDAVRNQDERSDGEPEKAFMATVHWRRSDGTELTQKWPCKQDR